MFFFGDLRDILRCWRLSQYKSENNYVCYGNNLGKYTETGL